MPNPERRRRQRTWWAALPLVVVALLAGCGGGGDDGGADPAAVTAAAAGVWAGTTSTNRDMTALVTSDGSYYLLYSGVGKPAAIAGFVQGTGIVSDGNFTSADGLDFNLESVPAPAATAAAVEGGVAQRFRFGGTIRPGTAAAVTFQATPHASSGTAPTLAALAGAYPGEATFLYGTRPAKFTVTAAGAVSGEINSCTITGTATPRSDVNAYDLTIVFGGPPCAAPLPGMSFQGIAHYADNRLLAAVRNSAVRQGIVFSGTR